MKLVKCVAFALVSLVILAGCLFGYIYFQHQTIPDLGRDIEVISEIYDTDYQSAIEDSKSKLMQIREQLSAPSVSLAVAHKGTLVWTAATGYADIENRSLADHETAYPIGSVSKPITAMLVMKLVENGEVDLDLDIREYVPAFPEKEYPVTLRQLLSHQAGIRHYEFAFIPPVFSEAALNEDYATVTESLEIFAEDELLFRPDSDFEYSTFGYTLISAALEGATGESFIDLLQEKIFDPLDMHSSSPDYAEAASAYRATDYVALLSRKAVMEPPATNSSYKWAGGGLLSTPTDLVKFGNALMYDRLLTTESREEMFTPRRLSSGDLNPQQYGLGWRVGGIGITDKTTGEQTVTTLINHGGTSSGAVSILFIIPEHDLVLAMTANSVRGDGSGQITSSAAKIAGIFARR